MNNSKIQEFLKSIECTCTCTEGGSDNPYCEVHGTECWSCGEELTNKACDNRRCSNNDSWAAELGYKTCVNNLENDCVRCIAVKKRDPEHCVSKQSLSNGYYLCWDCCKEYLGLNSGYPGFGEYPMY